MNYPPPQGWGAPPPAPRKGPDPRTVIALGSMFAIALVCGVCSAFGKRAPSSTPVAYAPQQYVPPPPAPPAAVPPPVPGLALAPDAADQLERFVHESACEPGRRRNTERCPPEVVLMGPIRFAANGAGVEATVSMAAARDDEGMELGARLCRHIITDARRPVPVTVLYVVGLGGQRLAFGRAAPGQAGPCYRADTSIWRTL